MRGATGITLQLHQILRLPRKMNLMIVIRTTYETSLTMRGATGITLQPHQILRLPRKNESHDWSASHMKRNLQCAEQQASTSNLTKYCAWPRKRNDMYCSCMTYETSFTMRGATGISLQPHQILRLPRKNEISWLIHITYETSFTRRRSNRHQPPTSPNDCACHAKWARNIWQKFAENRWNVISNARPIRDRSDHIRPWSDPGNANRNPPRHQRLPFALARSRFYWKLQRFPLRLSFQNFTTCCACHEKWHMNFTKCCACHEKWHMNVHQMLRLPRKVTHELHQMLRLPRKVTRSDTWLLLLLLLLLPLLLTTTDYY